MKIAVNTRFLVPGQLEGIGWFTFETIRRICKNHPEHEFVFLFDRPYDKSFVFEPNVTACVVPPPARHPLLWYVWFEFTVPNVLRRMNVDAFISTDGFMSLKTKVPTLLVIHDLAFEHYPEMVPGLASRYYRYFTPRYARKAGRIATVSQASSRDIQNKYGVEESKIDVVYNGSSEKYRPLDSPEKLKARSKWSGGYEFFVYIGSLHPRKNIARLLRAYDQFRTSGSEDVKLVLIGRKAWMTGEIDQTFNAMEFKKDVIMTGHLHQSEIAEILGASIALVYPSLFEGFGIPILEALNAGVPVITSKVSSMPEVAGNAGILVDPHDESAISYAMRKIYTDGELKAQLIKSGIEQKAKFSWDISAGYLWGSFIKMMGEGEHFTD